MVTSSGHVFLFSRNLEKQRSHRYVAVTEHGDVELADAHNGKFKRFKKMIAGYGDFVDPRNAGRKMVLDKEFSRKTSQFG